MNSRRIKEILFTFSLPLLSFSNFGQGTVQFVNRTSLGDWKIASSDGSGLGSIPGVVADLFLADANGAPTGSSLAEATFRTSPAAATYFLEEVDVQVWGLEPGNNSQRFVAVLSGGTGGYYIVPSIEQIPLQFLPGSVAGGGIPPMPPGELIPIDSRLLGGTYTITIIPEPVPTVFGLLGAAVFFLMQRKRSGPRS
jgi:hypothetical protein